MLATFGQSEITNEMIDLQIVLSKFVNAAEQLTGGILTLTDVCSYNKSPDPKLFMDFLDLMEVYGAQADHKCDSLQESRLNAFNRIT